MQEVTGIDVSKWQRMMNWITARAAGARFAIIRAGSIDNISGTCYTDFEFERNSKIAPLYMEAVGFYWYGRPKFNPIKQAEYFYQLIKNCGAAIYPTLDLEQYAPLDRYQVTSWAWVFCDRLEQKMSQDSMIYSNPSFLATRMDPQSSWMHLKHLWLAHWYRDEPWIPPQWRTYGLTCKFWQTGVFEDGPEYGAGSKRLDHDVYYDGDLDDFREEFQVGIEPPEPPDPCPHVTSVNINFSDSSIQTLEKA